jgi:hypothetical protein
VRVAIGADPLAETLLPRLNAVIARLGCPRRIHSWTTSADKIAFVCRSPDEVAAMIRDGLATAEDLYQCGMEPEQAWTDWSDVHLD